MLFLENILQNQTLNSVYGFVMVFICIWSYFDSNRETLVCS